MVCERWWRQGQTVIEPTFLLTIEALLPHLDWVAQTGVAEGRKMTLTLSFLSPTNSTAASTCLYSFITPTCFSFFFRLFTQVHLWMTVRSRVNIQHNQLELYNMPTASPQIGKNLTLYECSRCDDKLIPESWGMWSTPSLPLPPGSLWS